jgi:WD repeat-containing protein 48
MTDAQSLSFPRNARSEQRTVTYWCRFPEQQHRYGINAVLALQKPESQSDAYLLVSAGRDGSVRLWSIDHRAQQGRIAKQAHLRSLEEHTDWVNDVVSPGGYPTLVSCSSDATVKVWDLSAGACLATLVEHQDYVRALANVSSRQFVSTAYDNRIILWDLDRMVAFSEMRGDENESIYCIASALHRDGALNGSADCFVVAAGHSDRSIRLYDLRTSRDVMRLHGHADIVRRIRLSSNGLLCLSGGSDGAVRLWDIRQQRCLSVFHHVHEDSVWSLDVPPSFSWFVSGSRDGTVCRTDLRNSKETRRLFEPDGHSARREQVCDWSKAVLDVCIAPTANYSSNLWIGFGESQLRCVSMKHPDPTHECVIEGLPSVVDYRVLNNRRHVLVRDSENGIHLWDVCRALNIRSFDRDRSLDDVIAEIDELVYVPSWFNVDTRMGSLGIRLRKSTVSDADVYAVDIGLEAESEDQKVNIGEHTLRGLFHWWRKQWLKHNPQVAETLNTVSGQSSDTGSTTAEKKAAVLTPFVFPGDIPVVVNEQGHIEPLIHKLAHRFDGSEIEERLMPSWVIDIVGRNRTLAKEQVKISFGLEPAIGSTLQSLRQSKLTAPRILRIRKAMAYVSAKLSEQTTSANQRASPGGHRGALGASRAATDALASEPIVPPPQEIEILCRGHVLDPNMNLGTVRWLIWKSPKDLELTYRRRGEQTSNPAPESQPVP